MKCNKQINPFVQASSQSTPQKGEQGGGCGVYILGIESSCDDTSAAVLRDGFLLSNVTASQAVHEAYGGVVPELASRAHQQNIVPVVDAALKQAGIEREQLSAIAFTRGPGLMGSLLVGVSFAKGLAASLGIPMIDVNHLHGHVLAHFIKEQGARSKEQETKCKEQGAECKEQGAECKEQENTKGFKQSSCPSPLAPCSSSPSCPSPLAPCSSSPSFPFLCLLVSGGNSQIVLVKSYKEMEIIGQTIDDAAGEAIDKCSKVMGLGYPGGPIIDRLARQGNPDAFSFAKPNIAGYDYSFSGLKTSFLYSLRDWLKEDPDFIEHHKEDLAASLEKTIVDILMKKLRLAAKDLKIKQVAVAGGVSANTGLRNAFHDYAKRYGWQIFIPRFSYTTDNAAMIAIAGYFKYLDKDFCPMSAPAYSRVATQ